MSLSQLHLLVQVPRGNTLAARVGAGLSSQRQQELARLAACHSRTARLRQGGTATLLLAMRPQRSQANRWPCAVPCCAYCAVPCCASGAVPALVQALGLLPGSQDSEPEPHLVVGRPVALGPGGTDQLAHALGQTRVSLGANMVRAPCTCRAGVPAMPAVHAHAAP